VLRGQGSVEAALVDLKRAHLLSPGDETVKASYDELKEKVGKDTKIDERKLKEAEANLEAERAAAVEKKKKVFTPTLHHGSLPSRPLCNRRATPPFCRTRATVRATQYTRVRSPDRRGQHGVSRSSGAGVKRTRVWLDAGLVLWSIGRRVSVFLSGAG
jgi:hypothetical protein